MSFHVKTNGLFGNITFFKNALFFDEGKNTIKGENALCLS